MADTLDGNAPMIGLLRSSGVDVREEHELGRAEFVLSLVDGGSGALPQRHPHPHDGEAGGQRRGQRTSKPRRNDVTGVTKMLASRSGPSTTRRLVMRCVSRSKSSRSS